jgi:hypothetical protein
MIWNKYFLLIAFHPDIIIKIVIRIYSILIKVNKIMDIKNNSYPTYK